MALSSVTGPDRPDIDDVLAANHMIAAVKIDRRIAMRGEEFDDGTDLWAVAALEIQRAMLIAHEAEGGAGRRPAQRDGLAAVGGKGLPSGIHHNPARLVC